MGNLNSLFRIVEQSDDRLKLLWIPEHKTISFSRGKRSQDSEIISDRDFFYYVLFRILELYTWRHIPRKISAMPKSSSAEIASVPAPIQRRPSLADLRPLQGQNGSPRGLANSAGASPRSGRNEAGSSASPRSGRSSEAGSPRLQAVDDIIDNIKRVRGPNSPKSSPREHPIYTESNQYSSALRAEIVEAGVKIIQQYLETEDVGQTLLAINQYVIHLDQDTAPHFVNYRPNYECTLSVELGYKLNFYRNWMEMPQAYLYPHEWKFLLDQGIVLLDHIHDGSRQALGSSSSPRYLDLLLETERRIGMGKILKNPALPCYSEDELIENFKLSSPICSAPGGRPGASSPICSANWIPGGRPGASSPICSAPGGRPGASSRSSDLDTYLTRVLSHVGNDDNIVSRTLLRWYSTFYIG